MKSRLTLVPRVLGYRLFRAVGYPKMMPINVTITVTNMCNSRCKTCFIWDLYRSHPEKKDDEFTTLEFEMTFRTLGKQIFWATLSGGEPYLRQDLPKICGALYELCEPAIINIPTNGLLPTKIAKGTRDVLERCPDTTIIVNLSLDGLDSNHDKIRGITGNFEKFLESYGKLTNLKEEFSHLQVGIHSVISKFNITHILSVYDYARELFPDSYITEVAEQRTELFNTGKDITPSAKEYKAVIDELSHRVRSDYLTSDQSVSKLTQAFRLTYYQIASQELQEQRQIIPCYAGYASCQITPYGDIWPCCILGYDRSMGNLRETEYDFRKVWFSQKADKVRAYIKGENCACPLANAHYTNILCNFKSMMQVLKAALWETRR